MFYHARYDEIAPIDNVAEGGLTQAPSALQEQHMIGYLAWPIYS
jgi:hypothetical protein